MPPVAITFHSSRHSPRSTRPSGVSPLQSSVSGGQTIASRPRKPSTQSLFTYTKTPLTDKTVITPSPAPSASSSTSAGPPTATRRKSNPPPPQNTKVAHLTPLLQPIVSRCLASKHDASHAPTSTISPPAIGKKHSHPPRKSQSAHITFPVVHPYSRLTDLGNYRSVVPSPKEIARAERMEEEKVLAKKENAAIARTRRQRGTGIANGNGVDKRSASNRPVTRSTSPVKMLEEVPTIITEPASAESSPHPARMGLKRTRSQGLLPISTTLANAMGAGAVGLGSPLKAVTGPESEEDKDSGRSRKRCRLSHDAESLAPPRSARRANTTSPIFNASPLPTSEPEIPSSTFPIAQAKPLPRMGARSLSVAPSTTTMKRAVSAGVRAVGMGRVASAGAEAALGKERVKREVTMPGRLRDYVRAGTVV